MKSTYVVLHTISDTYLFVKHVAAKHLSPGIWSIAYRSVIKRANSGIAPALHNIFWSLEFWHIGTKILATHAWHCSVCSNEPRPIRPKTKANNRLIIFREIKKIKKLFSVLAWSQLSACHIYRLNILVLADLYWWFLWAQSYVHTWIVVHTNKFQSNDCRCWDLQW